MRSSTTTSRPSPMRKSASGMLLGLAIVMLILIGCGAPKYNLHGRRTATDQDRTGELA